MSINELKKQEDKRKVIISILKIVILIGIVIGIPLYIYFFQRDWLEQFKDFNDVVEYLEKYQSESILIYIGLQILQIVISVIPGQIFQLAAGYMYTFFPALLYAMTGAFIGTTITFYLSKLLGRDFVHLFFGKEKTTRYIEQLNSKRAYTIVFLLYLIPGIPKDMVSYAAGISEIKFKPFLILSLVGRLPGMMGSIMIGSMWHKEEYIGMIILGAVAVISFILCIIFRSKIQNILNNLYDKITH